jgi:hypothetical protein
VAAGTGLVQEAIDRAGPHGVTVAISDENNMTTGGLYDDEH